MSFRVGIGFDTHAFASGRKLMLGGVHVPYPFGLAGHSDADVVIHALCDALLGAAALGDIGSHFPDTDEKYRNMAGKELLQKVDALIKSASFRVGNADVVVIAQEPKISSHIPAMKNALSAVLGISIGQISVKATTTEYLGFTGRKEGISAVAVVLLEPL